MSVFGEEMTAMMRKSSLVVGICALLCLAGGCSSSKSNNPPPSGLQFTSPTSSPTMEVMDPPETVVLTVNGSVTWTLKSGCGFGKPIGLLSNPKSDTVTYVAPNAAPSSPCNPLQDLVVATDSANNSAVLSVNVVATPPVISNASSFTFTGTQCTSAGGACCPPGVSCCPPSSTQTIIQPPSNGVGGSTSQVGVYTSLGPLTASGGVPPYTWQLASGSLPAGTTLSAGADSTTGLLLGTPISSGCSTFALQVTDAKGVSGASTFNVVVIPSALKVIVPNYPAAYNDASQNGDPGLTYSPLALSVTNGIGPYRWAQDNPQNPGSTLPPGLALTASTSSSVKIEGTPNTGNESNNNLKGNNIGQYPSAVNISDSQLPYPAVGLASLPNMQDLALSQPCSPTNQADVLQPQGIAVNGGDSNGGPVAAESYLQGSLAFLLRGFDANGPVVIAGSVGLDGKGGITGGVEDVTGSTGSQRLAIQPSSTNPASYYVVGTKSAGANGISYSSYGRGCMVLATPAGNTTFAFTLGGCSNRWTENHLTATNNNACGMKQNNGGTNIAAGYFTTGHVIEFDQCTPGKLPYCTGSTRAAGILRWQDPSTFSNALSGRYAFGLSGWDAAGGHYAAAGSFQASGGQISSLAADVNDAGALNSSLTGGSGTYSSIDVNGNATGTLTVGTVTLPVSIYVISRNEIFLTTNPSSAGPPIVSGEAITTATSFGNSSLQNTEIFHIGGVSANGPDVSVGVLTFDGAGALGGTISQDQGGPLATIKVSAIYSVDSSTGRTVFSAPLQGQTIGSHAFVGYIVPQSGDGTRRNCSVPANCVAGFLAGTDSTAQDGILEFQTGTVSPPPPFTNTYIAGDYSYGVDKMLDQHAPAFEGIVYAQPSGATTVSGVLGSNPAARQSFFQDVSYSCEEASPQPSCLLLPSQLLTGTYSVNPDGTGTLGGGIVSVTNGSVTFYIDESPANLHPSVVVAEQ